MWQILKKLWHCCGVVWGTYIFWQWVVVQLKIEELAKVVGNRHLNPEDCSGMTWAESAEGWKTEGLCLMKVEIKHDLEGRNKNRNWRQLKQADGTSSPKLRYSRHSTSWTTEALNDWNKGWESLKTDADTIGVATVLLILAKKDRRFLPLTAGKGSLKQPRYLPFDQPHEKDVVTIRQRTVKTWQRTAKIWGNYA